MKKLTDANNLFAFKHSGFWQCMDTLREKIIRGIVEKNKAPWKIKK